MKNKFFSMFDYLLILLVFFLITVGIFFIYSSGVNSFGVLTNNEYIKQIIWASVGVIFMVFFTIYDYRKLQSISFWLYIGLIVLLILVQVPHIGIESHNARSWLGFKSVKFQPAEIGKIFYMLYLASYLEGSRNEHPLKRFSIAILILFIPFALILTQPDMGTASVYIPIFFLMCLFAGIPMRYLFYILAMGFLSIFLGVFPEINNVILDKKLSWVIILTEVRYRLILIVVCAFISLMGIIIRRYFHAPKYVIWITYAFSILFLALIFSYAISRFLSFKQKMRLVIFLNPEKDYAYTGYHIVQSKIAIGGGGLFGKGFLNGTQSHMGYLPEQSTDFIFSIFTEEVGFIGGIVIFAIYAVIFIKILFIIYKCPNYYGTLLAAGIFGMFTFHFIINCGMVMGIMPITGIPLLFMSYGGTALLSSLSCVGLLMSIRCRKKELN